MLDIELIEERKNKLINNATPSELCFIKKLNKWNIEYEFQYPIYIKEELTFYLDFYLPKYKIYIELDGKHHRIEQKIIDKDRWRKKEIYKLYNIKELRMRNKIIFNIGYIKFINKIKKVK